MENKISKGSFADDVVVTDTGCFIMAHLRIAGYGCGYHLYQQYGAGYEFDLIVF